MDDFMKKFNWRGNIKTISRIIKCYLKEQNEYVKISKFSIEDEDADYYISMLIGFKTPDNDIINNVSYTCFVNENKYHSYIYLYTGKNCKNVGYFGEHTIYIRTDKHNWTNVNDMAYSIASDISTDISTLKDEFGYKNCKEENCEVVSE